MLSAKFTYQEEQKRDPEGLSTPLSGSEQESKRANGARRPRRYLQKILVLHKHTYKHEKNNEKTVDRSTSRRGYHETGRYKAKVYWIVHSEGWVGETTRPKATTKPIRV